MNRDAEKTEVCQIGDRIIDDLWLLSVFANTYFDRDEAAGIWGVTADAAYHKLLCMTEQGLLLSCSEDSWRVCIDESPTRLPYKAVPCRLKAMGH
jgi:hypothetical protein